MTTRPARGLVCKVAATASISSAACRCPSGSMLCPSRESPLCNPAPANLSIPETWLHEAAGSSSPALRSMSTFPLPRQPRPLSRCPTATRSSTRSAPAGTASSGHSGERRRKCASASGSSPATLWHPPPAPPDAGRAPPAAGRGRTAPAHRGPRAPQRLGPIPPACARRSRAAWSVLPVSGSPRHPRLPASV